MFEAIELGHKVSKREFNEAEGPLRTDLLEAQRELRKAKIPVIILVSGVEGAGKSEVTNRLYKWLDARGLFTATFWDDERWGLRERHHWRFWRQLPRRGQIAIFFGSWYSKPIIGEATGEGEAVDFDQDLRRINDLERMLVLDGALIIKLWFHITKKKQAKRIEKRMRKNDIDGRTPTPWEQRFAKHYDTFVQVSERAIRATDTGICPWYLIEAKNKRHRDLTAGRVILDAFRRRLDAPPPPPPGTEPPIRIPELTVLDKVDLTQALDDDAYGKQLKKYQRRLGAAAWRAWRKGIASVILFEGWDAAGKGGAIRRMIHRVDARLFQVIPIGAPTDEELDHHYLWRFWRHVPRDGDMRIFDRSWYGRVLVERVEGFATPSEWRRAYSEITHFEEQLVRHGIVLAKFWIHLSQDEQLRRFEQRQDTPWKQHKITDEDWRNREQWDPYRAAVHDMVTRTSMIEAPWTLVAGDDKQHARVQIIKTVAERLEGAVAAKGE